MSYSPETKANISHIRVDGFEIDFIGFDSLDFSTKGLKRAVEAQATNEATIPSEETQITDIPEAA